MGPACINKGGNGTRILLEKSPAVEEEFSFSLQALEKLFLWRARPGEIVTVCDPDGIFFRARITSLQKTSGKAVVFEKLAHSPESPLRLDVYQALPEKERFELVLQKLTEIGVYRIIPYVSERSTTLELRDAGQKKSHRWPDVILRAAKQCRRGIFPELSPLLSWENALKEGRKTETTLVLSEKERGRRLKDSFPAVKKNRHIALFVGPEGGFSQPELAAMDAEGFIAVSLGSRIMRTETAAITGAAIVQTLWGDLG